MPLAGRMKVLGFLKCSSESAALGEERVGLTDPDGASDSGALWWMKIGFPFLLVILASFSSWAALLKHGLVAEGGLSWVLGVA